MNNLLMSILVFCGTNYTVSTQYADQRYGHCVKELTACMFCIGNESLVEGDLFLCLNWESEAIGAWESKITNPTFIKKCKIKNINFMKQQK